MVISGPVVMRGYLNLPEVTAQTIVDGWLHTGDVGILDDDGYLRIVGRIKDMIIRGGENIYPKEIESVLTAFDGVLDAAVVGRPTRSSVRYRLPTYRHTPARCSTSTVSPLTAVATWRK